MGESLFGNSELNLLLDTTTFTFSNISNRINYSYNRHSSGVFYNSTAGETQVAVVGLYGAEIWSPSSDEWRFEASFPLPLTGLHSSAAVQVNEEYFVLVGGHVHTRDDEDGVYSRGLYRFDENGVETINENALFIPREYHVAVHAPKQYANLYC